MIQRYVNSNFFSQLKISYFVRWTQEVANAYSSKITLSENAGDCVSKDHKTLPLSLVNNVFIFLTCFLKISWGFPDFSEFKALYIFFLKIFLIRLWTTSVPFWNKPWYKQSRQHEWEFKAPKREVLLRCHKRNIVRNRTIINSFYSLRNWGKPSTH